MTQTAATPNASVLPKKYRDMLLQHARRFDRFRPQNESRHDVGQKFLDAVKHFDVAESYFTARQLEYIRQAVYAIKYPDLKWSTLMPANFEVDTGAEQFTVQSTDTVGHVKVSKGLGGPTPMVQVSTREASMGFFSLRLGYQYSMQDARAAIYARRPLQTQMAVGVRDQMERKLDEIAFVGNVDANVKGLLTQSGTETYVVPASGASGSKHWEDKAPEDILVDLNAPIRQVITNSKEIEIPNTWLMPISSKGFIADKRVGDGSNVTVLQWFLGNQEHVKRVETTFRSESAPNSEWTGKRGLVYRNDPSKLEMIIPQQFEQMPAYSEGFSVITLCHMRTGGIALYAPKSMIVIDDI